MQTYILVAFVSGYLWVSEGIAYGRICVFTCIKPSEYVRMRDSGQIMLCSPAKLLLFELW